MTSATPTSTARLILADGLSGSGKSTMCQWLELQLQARGVQARWVAEADSPHPLHWWEPWDGIGIPPALVADDQGRSRFAPAELIATSLARWRDFAATVRVGDQVYLVESCLFLLGIDHLLRAGATPAELTAYGRQVEAIIADLDPCLLYFRQPDVAAHTRWICDIRGDDLERELIANLERTPYARQHGLTGLAAVVQLWSETQQITDALVAGYQIRTLTLETVGGDWATYYQQVQELLGMAEGAPDREVPNLEELARLVGRYTCQDAGARLECEIVLAAGRLHIQVPQPEQAGFLFVGPSRELIPIRAGVFYAGISPVVLSFEYDDAGAARAVRVDSTRLVGGRMHLWVREGIGAGEEE